MPSNPRRNSASRMEIAPSLKTNMLKKGVTISIISPSSPPKTTNSRPPPLPRRSDTNLDGVTNAHLRRVIFTIGQIDKLFLQEPSSRKSLKSFRGYRDKSEPLPRGILAHTLDTCTLEKEPGQKRLLPIRTRRNRFHGSDSGLGTSVASSNDKRAAAIESGLVKTIAITRSPAVLSATTEMFPTLGENARNRIVEHVVRPLLANPAFKGFHGLLLECPSKMKRGEIGCLRDIEKTLLLVAPEKNKCADSYLDFCLTTVQCIQATVEYLSDCEQTRPRDLPYSQGYFIDLTAQIRNYAQQLADSKEKKDKTDLDLDPTDEIKLQGGIHVNGRPAELVRVRKDGKVISLATGLQIEKIGNDEIRIKCSGSEEHADGDEIIRSMARRKKNASPEELAPKKCREPGCNKEFKRPCDLTKHEKTHSRPWKCKVKTCKYHEYGWPTEKERDRHTNDKHSVAPPMFLCAFKPCPYKSKRESNCKQHMEKAHGWEYVRTKTNGKKPASVHDTPLLHSMPTPISDRSMSVASPPDDFQFFVNCSIKLPAYHMNDSDFAAMLTQDITLDSVDYHTPMDNSTPSTLEYSPSILSVHSMDRHTPSTDGGMDHNSAYQDLGSDLAFYDEIYAANVQLPRQMNNLHPAYKQDIRQFSTFNTSPELCTTRAAPVSPVRHANTMLFTPASIADKDDGTDEQAYAAALAHKMSGSDIIVLPNNGVYKPIFPEPIHAPGMSPNMAPGFSQPNSQDMVGVPINVTNINWSQYGFTQ